MPKKLTDTENTNETPHEMKDRRRISQLPKSSIRVSKPGQKMDSDYERMARDKRREREAVEWIESMTGL